MPRSLSACKAVAKADFIKGARLWVDGFASFTGGEMALLIELLKTVDHAYVALCLDPASAVSPRAWTMAQARETIVKPESGDATICSSGARAGLFEPTARTYRDMLERLAEAKVKVVKPLILSQVPRFRDCPALAHVEQNIFRLGASKAKAGGDIRLVAAPSLRLEIQSVARQILGLVKEKGYRYRDIAVVASDLSHYEQYVRAYFEDYGVPFFIDKRKPLNQHPVVELICAALQAVTKGSGVRRCLRLSQDRPGPDEQIPDRCPGELLSGLRRGRAGLGRVREPWRFQGKDDEEFDEDQINRIRDEAIGPLLELRQALCPDGDLQKRLTAGEFTRVLFAFLDRLHVRKTVHQWVSRCARAAAISPRRMSTGSSSTRSWTSSMPWSRSSNARR